MTVITECWNSLLRTPFIFFKYQFNKPRTENLIEMSSLILEMNIPRNEIQN